MRYFVPLMSELGQKHTLPRRSIAVRFTSINRHYAEDNVEAAWSALDFAAGLRGNGSEQGRRACGCNRADSQSDCRHVSIQQSRAPRAVGPSSLRHNQRIERGCAFSFGVNHQRIDIDPDNVRRGLHQPAECEHGLCHRFDIGWRRTAKASEQL
jgi:hypothetical protein